MQRAAPAHAPQSCSAISGNQRELLRVFQVFHQRRGSDRLAQSQQVREREADRWRAQHREPGTAITGIEQGFAQGNQVAHHQAIGQCREFDAEHGNSRSPQRAEDGSGHRTRLHQHRDGGQRRQRPKPHYFRCDGARFRGRIGLEARPHAHLGAKCRLAHGAGLGRQESHRRTAQVFHAETPARIRHCSRPRARHASGNCAPAASPRNAGAPRHWHACAGTAQPPSRGQVDGLHGVADQEQRTAVARIPAGNQLLDQFELLGEVSWNSSTSRCEIRSAWRRPSPADASPSPRTPRSAWRAMAVTSLWSTRPRERKASLSCAAASSIRRDSAASASRSASSRPGAGRARILRNNASISGRAAAMSRQSSQVFFRPRSVAGKPWRTFTVLRVSSAAVSSRSATACQLRKVAGSASSAASGASQAFHAPSSSCRASLRF